VTVAGGGQQVSMPSAAPGRHLEPFDVVITDFGMPYVTDARWSRRARDDAGYSNHHAHRLGQHLLADNERPRKWTDSQQTPALQELRTRARGEKKKTFWEPKKGGPRVETTSKEIC